VLPPGGVCTDEFLRLFVMLNDKLSQQRPIELNDRLRDEDDVCMP
jgi:hypothetical protein